MVSGVGISSISEAATLGLPGIKPEIVAKGESFKPKTSIEGYEYVSYIHTVKDHEAPVIPEEKEETVYVHYVNEEGNTIEDDVTLAGTVGYILDGYTFKEVRGNATDTFKEQPQESTYI